MKTLLTQVEINSIESKLKSFEANTGCELLLISAQSSDLYPGASWRFGVIAGFILTFIFALYLDFHHAYAWPLFMVCTTLFMTWVGHFTWAKKLALNETETDRETYEKALEYFHTLGTSKVSHKVTAMIMVSLLEKKIMVLVDEKLKTKISQPELDQLIQIMQKHFKEGHPAQGFIQSIEILEDKILKDFGGKVSEVHASELKDCIHFL